MDHLIAIQRLDPVPPTAQAAAACEEARAALLALRPLVTAAGAGPGAPAASLQLPQYGGGAAAAAVRDAVKGMPSDQARSKCLISVLASACCSGSPLRREEGGLPAALQPVAEEAAALVAPSLAALAAFTRMGTPRGDAPASGEGTPGEGTTGAPSAEMLMEAEAALQQLAPRMHQVHLHGYRDGSSQLCLCTLSCALVHQL